MRRLILALTLCLALPAHAGDDAELNRLREGLQRHVANNIWQGAERTFREMEALDADGTIDLAAEDWLTGVTIARNQGDMAAVRQRLQQAFELEPSDDLRRELASIASNYGPLYVEFASGFGGERTLTPESPPFETDKRAAIASAQERLAAGGSFDGLLPLGRYTVSGTAFEVATGAIDAVRVRVASDGSVRTDRVAGGAGGSDDDPGLEILIDLGVAFTSAGPASSGVQPAPFSGPGLRAGVGVNLWPADKVGLQVELGYHGLMGGGAGSDSAGNDLPANGLNLGFASLGPAVRLGALTVTVGAEAAIGSGTANGLDLDAWNALCDDRPQDVRCAGQGTASDTSLNNTAMSGRVVAVGPVAGGTWTLAELGPLRPAVGLSGGALSDGARWIPWAQAALVIRL